jgi:Na+-transporting NADH:ubiquinone oxidoreductase subunit F
VALSAALGPRLRAEQFPHRARVVEIEDLTHDTKRIRFRLIDPKGFRFTPGQYLFLQVPDAFVAKWNERYRTSHKEVARAYSFASSSSRLPEFDLMIKLAAAPPGLNVPPGVASTFVHTALKKGDAVSFSAPAGNLYLRQDTGRPVIIVAGGTGAAPFVSLLEYWFESGFERNNQVYFFFGVRARRDLFLDERFRAWEKEKKIRYYPALSNPSPDDRWQGETGFIQTVVEKHLPAAQGADAYLAGPPVMVRETVKVLNAKGIGNDRIHFDEIAVR